MWLDHGSWDGVHRIHGHTILCVSRGEVIWLNVQLAVGRGGLAVGPVAVLGRAVLAVAGQHVVTVLGQVPGEGDDVNGGRSAVVLAAPPGLPLDLLLSQTTAGPTEGGAEHDGQAEAQHGHEDLKYRKGVHQQRGRNLQIVLEAKSQ